MIFEGGEAVKMNRKIKKSSVWFLVLSLILSGTILFDVSAARGVETERKCSATFEVGGDLAGDFAELSKMSIPIKLYKVAEINETGSYTAVKGYEALDFKDVTSETTAKEWEEKAQKAEKIIEDEKKAPTAEGIIQNGKGKTNDLSVGMYLVAAETVRSPEYEYKFTSYLLSLPNNYYSTTGNDDWVYDVTTGLKPSQEVRFGNLVIDKTVTSFNETLGNATFVFQIEGNDDWVYDVTTGLKPSQEVRFGNLVIDKTVTSFNETLGNATFVFQIEGQKDGEQIYSDVVSAVFDAAGTKSILVDKIPAGTEVTVTEIYSGASYELTSEPSQTVIIKALEDGETDGVHVTFTNSYDNRLNGGASVVNHFANEEGVWTVEQQSDSVNAAE